MKSYNLHLISDATGETLVSMGRAVSAQYSDKYKAIEYIYPMVRSRQQVDNAIENIKIHKGVVIYTIVNIELASYLEQVCERLKVPCKSVLEPILTAFSEFLAVKPNRMASAQHVLNDEYFTRQEAINFTLLHDDGQMPNDLKDAEIILLGISRTSKTPTSLYLANRGIKTANVPIVSGINLPNSIFDAKKSLIVGLIANPFRIVEIRKNRHIGSDILQDSYCDLDFIKDELKYARMLYNKYNIPVIDVSNRSVEETSAEILKLWQEFKNNECESDIS